MFRIFPEALRQCAPHRGYFHVAQIHRALGIQSVQNIEASSEAGIAY